MAFYKVCGNYYGTDNDANSLMHWRPKGSKNGVRRYQYEDGTLTPLGRIHYGVGRGSAANSVTAYTDTGTGYKNPVKTAKGTGIAPNGGAVGTWRAESKVRYKDSVPGYADSNPSARARLGLREPVNNTVSNVLGRDARPTGINKTIYDASVWGRQAASDVNKAVDDAKNWVGDRASDVKNWGEQASRDVDKAVDNAKNWVGDRASDVKNWGEQAVGNVKKAGDSVGDWVGDRASDVKNWGEQAGRDVGKAVDDAKNWVGARANGVGSAVGKTAKNVGDWVNERAKDVESSSIGKAAKNAGDWVGDRASDVKNWGEQAGRDVGKAAKNAGDWVGDRASDVKKAGDKVGDWVGARAKDVSSWGSGAVNKGRDFITGLFGKKKKQSAPEPKKSNAIDLKKIAGKNVSKPKK